MELLLGHSVISLRSFSGSEHWWLGLVALTFAQANTGAPAVLVDELDAGGFECVAQRGFICPHECRHDQHLFCSCLPLRFST
jgi:hypothetical protein